MLYNESTGKPKADVFSLGSLIAWLETMPAKGRYVWIDCSGGCLLGKYASHVGAPLLDIHTAFFCRSQLHIASVFPHTFGAALARAKAAE